MSRARDRYGQHPYGSAHRAQRIHFSARMRAGEVFNCWRCGEPIDPAHWDLGHVDAEYRPQFGHRHPEHPACNRATVSHLKAKAGVPVPGQRHDCREEFDPQRCSECRRRDPEPLNTVTIWSRHWSGPFNPRCPTCRATGEPCELAKRHLEQEAT
jgi:hypothetical protein